MSPESTRPGTLLGSSVIAIALLAAAPPARADGAVSIWYRSAEGCPSAASFLERLAAHAVTATVARAGDRIDFVVTLDHDPGGSSGSLERQSSEGKVALRRVEAARCDAVADALALTLALSADNEAVAPEAPGTPPASANHQPPAEPREDARSPTPVSSAATTQAPLASPSSADAAGTSPLRPGFGAHASIGTFAEDSALLGGSAFFEVALDRGPRPSARAGFVAGFAAPGDTLHLELLLGRLQACPVTIGRELSFVPCVALDLGGLRARNDAAGGRSDSGFWSAAWLLGRGAYAPSPGWAIELEGGISAPLARYELAASDPRQILASTRQVTVGLAAGVRIAWP